MGWRLQGWSRKVNLKTLRESVRHLEVLSEEALMASRAM